MELDRTAGAGDRAARGPGLAGAQLFAERGARVALAEIAGGVAEQAAQRIRCDAIAPCDVTMPDDVRNAVADTVLTFGGLEVMVRQHRHRAPQADRRDLRRGVHAADGDQR